MHIVSLMVPTFVMTVQKPGGGEFGKVFDDHLGPRYFVGSGGCHRHSDHQSKAIPINLPGGCLAWPELAGAVDLMELFGGESGAGRLH